ncbi:hydantoinase B/oxoprolinase family protein, partial [Actinomadura adrarensis]
GWGDPLNRDPSRVVADVRDGKVSPEGAREDYGVVITGDSYDKEATEALRQSMRAERGEPPFFDRGPGYPTLSGGRTSAEADDF